MKTFSRIIVLFCALVPVAVSGASSDLLTIVSPDSPLPNVVAAEGFFADPYHGGGHVHQDAAADLCHYLSRVTGRDILPSRTHADAKITIHVGPDEFVQTHAHEVRDLFADGFLLRHINVDGHHHVILAGIRWYSSRWAVEEFLKQFAGVRWLFPGDARYGEIIPSMPAVTIDYDLDQKHEPDYMSRSTGTDFFILDSTKMYPRLGQIPWNFGGHAFQSIFKQDDYEEHPEWFALFTIPDRWVDMLKKGTYTSPESVKNALSKGIKRQRWFWGYGNGWQICTSNPETVKHAVKYARDFFRNRPDSPIVSLGHNDTDGWCECDLCKEVASSVDPPYTVSEQYWRWVNLVAQELAETDPDKLITTIAYGLPATPPRFPLENNVAVSVTIYSTEMLDVAERWREKCPSVNLYSYAMGDWWVGFRHYPHAMRDFLKWGHDKLNSASHFSEVHGGWAMDGPKYHYMQALMWDVDADPNKLMQEYCHDMYGPAASAMKDFWDRLEQVYERRGHPRRIDFYTGLGWNPDFNEFDLYNLEDVALMDDAVSEAKRVVVDGADRFRLERTADAWKYFRAFLLGKLKFGDHQEEVLAEAERSPDRAKKLARTLAELQSSKAASFRLLRAYPHITAYGPQTGSHDERWCLSRVMFNQNMLKENHLNHGFSYVPEFSDMRTILDGLCERITAHLVATGGRGDALSFWRKFDHDAPLYGSAQTQIYMIHNPERPNLLAVSTSPQRIPVSPGARYRMLHNPERPNLLAVSTSPQRIPVSPGARYRLAVRAKCTSPPDADSFLSSSVSFNARNYEPVYRKTSPHGTREDVLSLETTFTAPPIADTTTVSITATVSIEIKGSIELDNVILEKIQDGPSITHGMLVDNFGGNRIKEDTWIESPAGRSGFLPSIEAGMLSFDTRPMATLVSLGNFENLLSGEDNGRYRLRLHVSKGDAEGRDALLEFGIRPGNVAMRWDEAGVYFTHVFSTARKKEDVLHMDWYYEMGHPKKSGGPWSLAPANLESRDAWYTIYFDPANVTIYAGTEGYDETENALVGKYGHRMTDDIIAFRGHPFLKLWGTNANVHEISLILTDAKTP